jgi:hypothetical protein
MTRRRQDDVNSPDVLLTEASERETGSAGDFMDVLRQGFEDMREAFEQLLGELKESLPPEFARVFSFSDADPAESITPDTASAGGRMVYAHQETEL